jgi:rapamycin-insensitive companion of mTOR
VPPHFYGEMAKTALGCKVLEEKGHFPEFAHFIRQHGLESEDFEIINKLKSVLWAVVSMYSCSIHITLIVAIPRVILELPQEGCLSLRRKILFET